MDSGYRGEIKIIIYLPSLDGGLEDIEDILRGYVGRDPIAQLAIFPVPRFDIVEVDELSPSDRGTNGFGSTNQGNNALRPVNVT